MNNANKNGAKVYIKIKITSKTYFKIAKCKKINEKTGYNYFE